MTTQENTAQAMPWVYTDGGRMATGRYTQANVGDCVPRSLAIAMGRPYADVYDELAEINRRQRNGKKSPSMRGRTAQNGVYTESRLFTEYMRSHGWAWVPPCKKPGQMTRLSHMAGFPGAIIVSLPLHYMAIVDGVIHDTFDFRTVARGRRKGITIDPMIDGYWVRKEDV